MKKPTLEEVARYFANATVIKDYFGDTLFLENLDKDIGFYEWDDCYWANDSSGYDYILWHDEKGYAEIIKTRHIETNDFKEITDSISSLLQYKNEKYGNSALEPLNIFRNKCSSGDRLDDKIARIKNSKELHKNDVADLIGYLILTCKENNWNNFDEFKD